MQNEEKVNNDSENVENQVPETEAKSTEETTGPDYKAMYEEANDKFLRLYSEFDNFKKRTSRERLDLIKSAGSDVLKSVLPVLDDFERAIKANDNTEDLKAIKEGFLLINHKLYSLLEMKGLKKMEVIGQPLDTDLHEAITQVPAPSEEMKGKVMDVVENGYYLNDMVLRFAKVIVGS